MIQDDKTSARIRWARLRFQIIGPLLASAPEVGELRARLEELASKPYRHPTRGVLRFDVPTIERWFYHAEDTDDPIVALEGKVPKHAGLHPGIGLALGAAIARQVGFGHPKEVVRGAGHVCGELDLGDATPP